jgi:tetratricopeptide (TPR) repeat protein
MLDEWIDAHPEARAALRADVHRRAAHACALLNQPEEALLHAEKGIALAPNDPWLHYARGVAIQTMGEYTAALDAFSRALELDPRHVKASQWRGYTHLLVGSPAEAVRDYDHALAVIQEADDAALRAWGASRRDLTVVTLRGRADALDALGNHDAAEADRAATR